MRDFYKVLGVPNSATSNEIRRAYRILARRYHPDVNPGSNSATKFNEIQEAYNTLRDAEKRRLYDISFDAKQRKIFESKLKGYSQRHRAQQQTESQKQTAHSQENSNETKVDDIPENPFAFDPSQLIQNFEEFGGGVKKYFTNLKQHIPSLPRLKRRPDIKVSIVEVSITVEESLKGVRKKIEIPEPEGTRKVSITLPPGIRTGSVIRMRNKKDVNEDLVLIVRLASHPFLSISAKGLTIDIPVTIHEACFGAQIRVPTMEDSVLVKIPAGSQSGQELRVRGKGIVGKNKQQGDLFVKLLVMVPPTPEAHGLEELATKLGQYYEGDVREHLPRTLT